MRKLRTSLMACVLVFTMLIATCATSFAAVFTDEEIANAQAIVNDVKAEIAYIIDVAKNGTNEEKVAAIDAYVADLKATLVYLGVSEATLDAVEDKVRAAIDEIILFANASDAEKEEKIDAYVEYVKSLFDLTPAEDDYVDGVIEDVKDEINEIVDIVETGDKAAAEEKVNAYINFLKDTLELTAEDEAMITEIVADITALIEEIQTVSSEDVEAVVDSYIAELQEKVASQLATLGHKKYVANEGRNYVVMGGNTVHNVEGTDKGYYDLLATQLNLDVEILGKKGLLPSEVIEYIDEEKIENADLITYQLDASSFIFEIISTEDPDWDKYINAETKALIEEVWAQVTEVLNSNWVVEGNAIAEDIATEVKVAVLENLPATSEVTEADVDAVINFCLPYVNSLLNHVEEKKNLLKGEATETIAAIDPVILDCAEKLAYAVVSYAVETVKAIETIQSINPDATLYVVGMYNPVRGLEIELEDTVIDAEKIFDYVIAATNVYYATYAAINKDFAFVDVSDAATDGFEETIDVNAIDTTYLANNIDSMFANIEGHEYIKEQILAAMTCDCVCEQLDGSKHTVKCTICGDSRTEAHNFSGKTCTECGYVKRSGGGSSGGNSVKEETPASAFKFTDVQSDKWYYDTVKKVVEKGLMNGISETKFAPELEVTRGMFVTILYRAAGEPEVSAATNFADVTTDKYYAKAVAWANANGIVKGISETEFAPDNNITREQMATILYRYAKNKAAAGEITYTDKHAISDYAMEAVAWAKAAGIMQGNADGTFAPVRNASRAEAAAVFVRMFKF